MTAMIDLSATPGPTAPHDLVGPAADTVLLRLIRSEFRKILSTRVWWLASLGLLVATVSSQLLTNAEATGAANDGFSQRAAETFTAQFMTAGSYFGGLAVMLLATLLITNEFQYQTATTTFLAAPRRDLVIAAKFATAMVSALALWAATSVINLAASLWFSESRYLPTYLDTRIVARAVILNALVYLAWSVFGIGLGALFRHQLAATITATMIYTVGTYVVFAIALILRTSVVHSDGIYTAMVALPSVAATTATSAPGTSLFPNQPTWWVCMLILAGYGLVMGVLGTRILRKIDIS